MSAPADIEPGMEGSAGVVAAHTRSSARHRSLQQLLESGLPALTGAGLVAIFTGGHDRAAAITLLAFAALVMGSVAARRGDRWIPSLPLMRVVWPATGPVMAVAMVAAVGLLLETFPLRLDEMIALVLATTGMAMVPRAVGRRLLQPSRATRVALIGSDAAATRLDRELKLSAQRRYSLVGRIAAGPEVGPSATEVRLLGSLGQLGDVVARGDIHLLLMTAEVPRLRVFDEIANSSTESGVRLLELSEFTEELFGHVPVAEINAAWFQYILHPRYRSSSSFVRRGFDLLAASMLAVLFFPLLAILAPAVKADVGTVFFRQRRIGRGGRPFTLYKLRTMKAGAGLSAQWASIEDPRITRLGGLLRKTHLDEFPQIFNVFRGEMSIVGPRPEQAEFVERLEQVLPYYQRRHLMKPGITGWAQVRCGYAGSDRGSAWKFCHDLFYLKHHSAVLDLIILGETVRAIFADSRYAIPASEATAALVGPALDQEPEPSPQPQSGSVLPFPPVDAERQALRANVAYERSGQQLRRLEVVIETFPES